MTKALVIDAEKCTGCRICEMVCSFSHAGVFKPSSSRVDIKLDTKAGTAAPKLCVLCETCSCIEACPENAIIQDEKTKLVTIDRSKCTGCKECVFACPYGAVRYEKESNFVLVCDQCEGDPECVKTCFTEALVWVAVSGVS